MLKRIINAKKDEGGFTLIEMLIVIVILAILTAVVLFAVGGLGDRGQGAACDADYRTLATAEEAYYANHGATYTDGAGLVGAKLIAKASTLHSVTLDSAGQYVITGIGKCA